MLPCRADTFSRFTGGVRVYVPGRPIWGWACKLDAFWWLRGDEGESKPVELLLLTDFPSEKVGLEPVISNAGICPEHSWSREGIFVAVLLWWDSLNRLEVLTFSSLFASHWKFSKSIDFVLSLVCHILDVSGHAIRVKKTPLFFSLSRGRLNSLSSRAILLLETHQFLDY